MSPTSIIVIAAVVIILIIIGVYFFMNNNAGTALYPTPTPSSPVYGTASPFLSSTPSPSDTSSPGATPTPSASPSATPKKTATPTPTPTPSASQTFSVNIAGFAFSPTPLTVKVNDTVKWTNQDSVPHQVISDTNAFSSGTFGTGQSYSFKFTSAGTYTYHCQIHPYMQASIIVTP